MKDNEQLVQIFSLSQILDVDLSRWHEWVRLCVLSPEAEYIYKTPVPIFFIDFLKATRFACTFHHHERVKGGVPKDNFAWSTTDVEINRNDNRLVIKLSGAMLSPTMLVECESYEISFVSTAMLDELSPKWRKSKGSLVRPGIDELVDLLKGKRRK